MADFWNFARSVLFHWYAWVTGTVFVLDQMLQWSWPKGKVWLDARWPAHQRRPAEIATLVVLLLASSFEAYHEMSIKAVAAQSGLDQAAGRITQLEADLRKAEAASSAPAVSPITAAPSEPRPPAPNPTPGPMTANDFPILMAGASPISEPPNLPYVSGSVYADPIRKTASVALEIRSTKFPIALNDFRWAATPPSGPVFSTKVGIPRIMGGFGVTIAIKPRSIAKFVKSKPKIHVIMRAANGQTYYQDLPLQLSGFN
jgi:hypothetical protein